MGALLRGLDANMSGRESALGTFSFPVGSVDRANRGPVRHRLDRHSGVEQGGEGHIAADAAKTVKMGDGAVNVPPGTLYKPAES